MITDQQKKEIVKLFKAGYTVKEIAAKIKLTVNQVTRAISKMRKKGIEIKRWWED